MEPAAERFLRGAHLVARLVEQVLERGYLRSAAGARLTFDQLNLLKFLDRPGTRLVRDVAHFLNASNAAASKAVARLERKGLVRRRPLESDARAEELAVTPRGREVIGRYESFKARRIAALARAEDLAELAAGLERTVSLLLRERAVADNPCLGCGAYYSARCVVRAHGLPCRCRPS